jgi:CHAD domain-containing protein
MSALIFLPIKEANLLRSRLQNMLRLREVYLSHPGEETIHDLRVASRRAREVLDYLQPLLSEKWYERLMWMSRRVTKSMGRLRETEVNLQLLQDWHREKKIDPVAAELLIFFQKQEFEKFNRKGKDKIGSTIFVQMEKFLRKIHGNRSMPSMNSGVLDRRNQEFLSFSWEGVMDDERLHDLRIRTKTFRYAVEIYDRLHDRNLGRFTRRIRNLQDVLGRLHDLYVLVNLIGRHRDSWNETGLTLVPRALERAFEFVNAEKSSLYPRVLPLYTRVLENSPLLRVGTPMQAVV